MLKAAIIIPAYNEERRIGKTLQSYSEFFEGLKRASLIDYEILVAINNTTDDTEKIVRKYESTNKNIKHVDLLNGGKGYAVIEGFKHYLQKDFELIGFVDADMATSPQEYYRVIQVAEKYDGAIADRYMPGSKILPKPSIQRLMAKRIFNFAARSMLLIPFSDTQCGAKVFKKSSIEQVLPQLSMSHWAFDVELLYLMEKNSMKIKTVPTIWIDKEYSKINFWQAGPWMALAILRLRILNSPFKLMLRIYDKMIGYVPR